MVGMESSGDPDQDRVVASPGDGDAVGDADGSATGAPAEASAAVRAARRGPGVVTTIGILLVCLGLAGLGWIGYQYYGTNAPAERAASVEMQSLREQWRSPGAGGGATATPATAAPPSVGASPAATSTPDDRPAASPLGAAMALIRIPRFGATYEKPILVGTSDAALARGVAWYETTARPGQLGNFALAGHRVTNGEPFARLLELQVGDEVIVETRDYVYTYVVDTPPATLTVTDVDTWVLDPVPGKQDVPPTRALITLTTCQDLFHSPDRSVGFGHLTQTTKK